MSTLWTPEFREYRKKLSDMAKAARAEELARICPHCAGQTVKVFDTPKTLAKGLYVVQWYALYTSCCPCGNLYYYRQFTSLEEARGFYQSKKERLEQDCQRYNKRGGYKERPNITLYAPGGKAMNQQLEMSL